MKRNWNYTNILKLYLLTNQQHGYEKHCPVCPPQHLHLRVQSVHPNTYIFVSSLSTPTLTSSCPVCPPQHLHLRVQSVHPNTYIFMSSLSTPTLTSSRPVCPPQHLHLRVQSVHPNTYIFVSSLSTPTLTSSCPVAVAMCKGVLPSLSWQLMTDAS